MDVDTIEAARDSTWGIGAMARLVPPVRVVRAAADDRTPALSSLRLGIDTTVKGVPILRAAHRGLPPPPFRGAGGVLAIPRP